MLNKRRSGCHAAFPRRRSTIGWLLLLVMIAGVAATMPREAAAQSTLHDVSAEASADPLGALPSRAEGVFGSFGGTFGVNGPILSLGFELTLGTVAHLDSEATWASISFHMHGAIGTILFAHQGTADIWLDSRIGGSDAFIGLSLGFQSGGVRREGFAYESDGYSYQTIWMALQAGFHLARDAWVRLGPKAWYVASQSGDSGNELRLGRRADSFGNFLLGGILSFDIGRGEGLYVEGGGPLFIRVFYWWNFGGGSGR